MFMKKKIATTVKIPESLYDDFKVLGIRRKISLQTLVEKCVNLFVEDDKFREIVNNYSIPVLSPEARQVSFTVFTGSTDPTPTPQS
jgi:hypothetical protein